MSYSKRPEQKDIQGQNTIEQYFLDRTAIYKGQYQKHLMIDQIEMNSANNDLNAVMVQELMWPSKEQTEEVKVQHSLPGRDDIITDTVTRKVRVPMSPEEAVEHYARLAGVQVQVLTGYDGKEHAVMTVEKPKAVTKKSTTQKTTKKPPVKKGK